MIEGLIIDSFAGGGGASTGIEWALGRSPDIAINHDDEALAMHVANHPQTIHLRENVWNVDPHHVTGGKPVALLWASPDCRHHSKAKGGKPVSKSVRGLADIVIVWARTAKPQVIFLENVEEFEDWGPLGDDDRPCPNRKGQEFRRWVRTLEDLGYAVEWRQMRACDYGAPTIRKRLFLVARRDGKPILWPAATHGDPKSEAVRSGALKPWRTAAEIIDWSIPCPSIFLTKREAKERGLRIIRPLAEKTLARIARGFKRYVLDRSEPFVVMGSPSAVPFASYGQHGGANRAADSPIQTVTASDGDQNQVVVPYLAVSRHDATGQVIDKPLPTITANSFIKRPGAGGPLALVTPYLAGVGGRMGQSGERPTDAPYHTITTKPDTVLVAPHLMTMRNSGKPFTAADEPTHTITAGGAGLSLVAGYLAQHNGNGVIGRAADEPLSTVTTAGSNQQPVMAYLVPRYGERDGQEPRSRPVDQPAPVVVPTGNGAALVSAPFMTAYYGTGEGAAIDDPLRTATTKDRFSLADCAALAPPLTEEGLAGARRVAEFLREQGAWTGGEVVTVGPFVVVDIGMRMLTPRELARAQGFPEDYILDAPLADIRLTETAQRHKIGNSVSPYPAAALVRANMIDAAQRPDVRRKRATLPPAFIPPAVDTPGLPFGGMP